MPILVNDYSWSETEGEVNITLPLKGVKSSKADVFTTGEYIKVNYPPYLFEVHLHRPVLEEKCSIKIGNGVMLFNLVKETPDLWGRLAVELTKENKEAMMAKRDKAIATSHERANTEEKEKAKRKREEEQFAIKEQMRLEQEERERIEKDKQAERDKATQEVEEWKASRKIFEGRPSTAESSSSENTRYDIWTRKMEVVPPPPRKTGSIAIRFTPRPFSTAARESKAEEEQEWLAKMAAARKIQPPSENSDESINDKNPEFLKDRGMNFFKAGNFQAAVNVFSEAIRLNGSLPSLFSNRAACYLSMKDYDSCISDCCRALELLYPVVPANYSARAKVFVRRGTAYAHVDRLDLALQDYSAAQKLVPNDLQVTEDCKRIKMALIAEGQ